MTVLTAQQASSDSGCEGRALLLSMRPCFVNAILKGAKTVELRRTKPSLPPGSVVLLYATSPVKAILGWATLVEVAQGPPEAMLNMHREDAAISGTAFERYFEGSTAAVALRLDEAVPAKRPVALEALRSLGIQPPQSWRYLDPQVVNRIQER